ncbi:MAG: lytic transglycosylase domain-containing protein, partial [Acinetobacter sp.]
NNHYKNLNHATDSILEGKPVNVPHQVTGEVKKRIVDFDSTALPVNAKTIARKATQEGVDPSVALTISHIETGGSFSNTAKNPTSTAHGLFQILDKTWKGQGGGNRNSVDEQIRMGLKHIKQANNFIKQKIGRDPIAHEQYLGHLLGPSGAVHVLKADPKANLLDVVKQYDKKYAEAIVNNNGMKGLTVGQAIDKWRKKWNSLSGRYGGDNISTVTGMDGSSYDVATEIRPLSELITSNDALYGVNPNYPAELQPRDRTRAASRQQIESMANDLRPEWLADSPKLSDGAPITGLDGVVESGNGRTLAIGKAYAEGKADAYLKMVNDYAAARGMDISGIDQPVLVRTRLTDTDRVQFTKLANEADVAQFSAPERARTDVDRLPDASLINVNNDGTLNLDQSMNFVRGFIDQLPQSERANMQTPDGRLSQDGKRRIETALAQNTYEDGNLVARLSENLDDDSKNVLNALLRASPQLSQLGALVKQGGRHANTIATDLAQAAQKLSDIKASGQTVRDYLDQGQLIDDGLSVGARDFLNVFDQNKRSVKGIGEHIQSKIDEIEAKGDPR